MPRIKNTIINSEVVRYFTNCVNGISTINQYQLCPINMYICGCELPFIFRILEATLFRFHNNDLLSNDHYRKI